ncbi:MAG: 50S ribosomal protein L5 [Parcubacteria group bacterium]|nr:50S ribosomal protein L5 [Parcubacteria group bacterium]
MQSNLYKKYKKEMVPALKEKFGYKNIMQVPKISKIVINVGIGRFIKEANYIETVEDTLRKITGQKPIRTKAKKSISNFKVREGMEIGVSVILRGARMYYFLEKLVNVTFPRMRDFRGISDKSFDRAGNYAIGFKENLAFPEIKADEVDKLHGLQVIVNTTAKKKEQGRELLSQMGFPFK